MVERTDQLRNDIDRRRERISRNVDAVTNRVSPRRVVARGTYGIRRRVIDLKDDLMGNDTTEYPWQEKDRGARDTMEQARQRASESMSDIADMASEKVHEAQEAMADVPHMVRRQTRGNPIAAGLVAFGSGLLIASAFGPTSAERKAARAAQPVVGEAIEEAKEAGRDITEEMKDSSKRSVEEVRDEARDAGERLRSEASEAITTATDEVRR